MISWREQRGTCFNAVRERLQVKGSVIRSSGSDYLLYALLDAIIDSYFPKLEQINDKLDTLDEQLEEGIGRSSHFPIAWRPARCPLAEAN